MNLSLAIASFVAAGIGLLTLILQLALLARFDALKKQVLAAANSNNGSQRPPRDNHQNRRQQTNGRKGGRNEQSESQSRPKSQRVTGTVESSLRDINLRLKNAERSQEAARREVKETASGDGIGDDEAKRDSGQSQRQDRRQGKSSRGRRRRSSRSNRSNRQGQRSDESKERQPSSNNQKPQSGRKPKEEQRPTADTERSKRAEQPPDTSHDENQRVVVKRRMLNETEQRAESTSGHTHSEEQHSESAEARSETVAFGRQPAPAARKEPQTRSDDTPAPAAPETASDEKQEETQRGETVFGRR